MSKKIRIFLLLSFFTFVLSLLGVLLYFVNQNNALTTTDASVAGSVCTVATDCDSGLVCVDYGGTNKKCSSLKLNQICDKTTKLCDTTALTCVNNSSTSESYSCSDKKEYSRCATANDCDSDMSCVVGQYNGGQGFKYCSKLNNFSYCDKTTKLCGDGLTCVNITNQPGVSEQYSCTDGKNNSYCNTDTNCGSGLKCVEYYGKFFKCTNMEENSFCDINTKTCGTGLECQIANGVGKCIKKLTTTDTGVTCGSVDSNTDKKIDLVDFAKFATIYGKSCK